MAPFDYSELGVQELQELYRVSLDRSQTSTRKYIQEFSQTELLLSTRLSVDFNFIFVVLVSLKKLNIFDF